METYWGYRGGYSPICLHVGKKGKTGKKETGLGEELVIELNGAVGDC